jgi:hypothetical protein
MKNLENETTRAKELAAAPEVATAPGIEEPKPPQDATAAADGVVDRLRKLFGGINPRPTDPMRDRSKDRTRSLLLLIGGSVGAVLLFIAVFSTPPRPSLQESRSQSGPNLGRPAMAATGIAVPQGSVTPLLTADVRSADLAIDQLSPSDISGTSRRSTDEAEKSMATQDVTARRPPSYRAAPSSPRRADPPEASSGADDPLPETRIDTGPVKTPTFQYGATFPFAPEPRNPGPVSPVGGVSQTQNGARVAAAAPRSSIVFVREGRTAFVTTPVTTSASPVVPQPESESLLPPGTRLIARVDAVASSALQTPVVASVEYNYERDGVVVVPAGAKVIGEIRQVSADGSMDVRFHSLQTPDGRELPIEGTATSLDLRPLKGIVSGNNTGKKILSRTLSGVGTIASYVVGGGGGMSGAVTGETLLRDRVAGNIGQAGEEQLRNIASSQQITVTLPANTRFYVVLQKGTAAVSLVPPPAPARDPVSVPVETRSRQELPSLQELRELMDLKREIDRMYQESNTAAERGLQ